jgi:hypothetical protein
MRVLRAPLKGGSRRARSDTLGGSQSWPRIAQRELEYLAFRALGNRTTEEDMRVNHKNLDMGLAPARGAAAQMGTAGDSPRQDPSR